MRKYIPQPVKMFLKEFRLLLISVRNRFHNDQNLLRYRANVYSQNGEDGVLYELCRRLGITGGWLVEFGAWDGRLYSNTFRLLKKFPFQAVYIEGDGKRFNDLQNTASKYPIVALNRYVESRGENALDVLLKSTPLSRDFEILSIDIDGYDYQVWEGVVNYAPKIVVIEVNSGVTGYQVHGERQGTSFLSMLELGNRKGYSCLLHIGNMIFVRNDLIEKTSIHDLVPRDQKTLFLQYRK